MFHGSSDEEESLFDAIRKGNREVEENREKILVEVHKNFQSVLKGGGIGTETALLNDEEKEENIVYENYDKSILQSISTQSEDSAENCNSDYWPKTTSSRSQRRRTLRRRTAPLRLGIDPSPASSSSDEISPSSVNTRATSAARCRQSATGNRRRGGRRNRRRAETRPVPTVDGITICIGSSDEKDFHDNSVNYFEYPPKSKKESDVDEILNVKISWMCDGARIFTLGRFEPFSKVYKQLSEETGFPVERIVLSKVNGITIKQYDTPDSINLSIVDILAGSVTSVRPPFAPEKECGEENCVQVKFLVEWQKAPIVLNLKRKERMDCVKMRLAEKIQCAGTEISLWFDGDKVKGEDTPFSLDLEGGECFEAKKLKNLPGRRVE